jgi:hypothetical protein
LAKKKSKITNIFRFLTGYSLGFLCWVLGLHCLRVNPNGTLELSGRKFLKHLFKLFMWALEIALVYHVLVIYCSWLMQATGTEKATAFLVKSIIFLYIKVFWPRIFPEILPGFHVFFCPQCYQKQTFRFLPVSFQYGFFVTYLCRYCSCLVNGWGEQIFYPANISPGKVVSSVGKMLPAVLAVLVTGFWIFKVSWDIFNG